MKTVQVKGAAHQQSIKRASENDAVMFNSGSLMMDLKRFKKKGLAPGHVGRCLPGTTTYLKDAVFQALGFNLIRFSGDWNEGNIFH